MTERRGRPSDETLWLFLILAIAVLLRVWGLGRWDWEEDELYTLRDALDLGAGASATGAPGIGGRPVYYLIQHLLLAVLPPTPLMLRLPAFAFGILGVLATWWVGRRVFGGYAGLIAALLAALSPWHLYASQFARYWTLVYALSAAAVGMLWVALERDRPRDYLLTLGLFLLGTLTHPTFLFPAFGIILALHLQRPDGRFGLVPPTRRAVRYLWIPYGALLITGYVGLQIWGPAGALDNGRGRGLEESLRLVPAMIQWMGPMVAGCALAACLFLWMERSTTGRRWSALTVAGVASACLLLLVASFRTGVYSDYGISILPLIFVAVGGAVHRVAANVGTATEGAIALAGGLALAIGSAPETVSHLSDGSRFDYRPAFDYIRRAAPDRTVLGDIDPQVEARAPDLKYVNLGAAKPISEFSGVWLITSTRRYGLREAGPRFQLWVDRNCRRVLSREKPRFDYRLYRMDLYWCGPDPLPTAAPR